MSHLYFCDMSFCMIAMSHLFFLQYVTRVWLQCVTFVFLWHVTLVWLQKNLCHFCMFVWYRVGMYISTKVPDGKPYKIPISRSSLTSLSEMRRYDVTHLYKYKEGTGRPTSRVSCNYVLYTTKWFFISFNIILCIIITSKSGGWGRTLTAQTYNFLCPKR